jgi:hypothetical protein
MGYHDNEEGTIWDDMIVLGAVAIWALIVGLVVAVILGSWTM